MILVVVSGDISYDDVTVLQRFSFLFQAEDGIRDQPRSRVLGDVLKRQAMQQAGKAMAQQMCQDVKLRRDGDKVIIESTCAMSPKSKMVSRGVMSGDYQSAYREESETRFDPPMAGIQNVRTTTEARWVGACKAGQRPGDVVTADGMKMNLLDMVKAGPVMRGKAPAR